MIFDPDTQKIVDELLESLKNSITNIGSNPTVNSSGEITVETHIIDFNDDIYDEEISVSFLKYLRGETKYSSKQDLINSLKETVEICRNF